MGAPQIIFIVLIAMAGTVSAMKHGKPQSDHSFPIWFVSVAIQIGLMYWGGFFG